MASKSVKPSKASKPLKPATMDEYVDRFVWRLNREFASDENCRRIAADKNFRAGCAQVLRSCVDPECRKKFDAERVARMKVRRAALVKAIDGLEAAANLCRHQDPEQAKADHVRATNFMSELAGVDELINVRRHGRFADYSILLDARQVIEKALGPVTYETLANLVTATQLALGQDDAPVATAQSLRMNIENFLKRNPHWPTANSDPLK
jgi:hypothetical protein